MINSKSFFALSCEYMDMTGHISAVIESLRPTHWIKNFFLFIGIIYSGQLFVPEMILQVLLGFFLFGFASGAAYLLNDIIDIENDRIHPQKSKRPIASGRLGRKAAFRYYLVITCSLIPAALYINKYFCALIFFYLIVNVVYSLKAKEFVIIDVLIISLCFLIRVLSGCVLVSVVPSDWLVVSSINVSLFLGFCKRRQEMHLVMADERRTRVVLHQYNERFLDQIVAVLTATSLISYILYTVSPETVNRFGSRGLILTAPFVIYGLFRYLFLIYVKSLDDSPTDIIFKDKPFLYNLLMWGITTLLIIYFSCPG